ncbi:hypothetical protein LCGC14_3114620 [marine sediment metagenome]|uniref:SEC-C motif domain protein n=1 Tax=marine sediment metagenome TaxID=412755 RepID=A0A0F8W431_9ZZZZ
MKNVKKGVNVIQFPEQSKEQGRNELCSCGSGKKFKKCCLVKKQAEGAANITTMLMLLYRIVEESGGTSVVISKEDIDTPHGEGSIE